MVSPSKAKLSKIASQQQQQPPPPLPHSSQQKSTGSSNNKVKLVKGPKPLIYHRFYLDIERHQVATKIETTIKELGGSIEFFLNKDITHFITDKHQQSGHCAITAAAAGTGERNEEQSPSTTPVGGGSIVPVACRLGASPDASSPGTPLTRNRQLQQQQRDLRYHPHQSHQPHTHGQYVNDYGPATSRTSSPCPPPTTTSTPSVFSTACTTGAASVQQQAVAAGVATFVSGSSTASAPTATAGLDGNGKLTQPITLSHAAGSTSTSVPAAVVLPRSRADAMLHRVRQQQHHQHQLQQQPSSYHLLHSSPLNPPPVAYAGTPTKGDSPARTPPSFHSSSHHKQQHSCYSPCYSPVGAGPGSTSHQPVVAAASRQNSPVQLARSWGTPVWTAEHALKFLRKVLDSIRSDGNRDRATTSLAANDHRGAIGGGRAGRAGRSVDGRLQQHRSHRRHHQTHQHQHAHHLRGKFIKIECRSAPANFRPVYQEFKRWPVLLTGGGDFFSKKTPFADVHEPPEKPPPPPAARVKGGGEARSTVDVGGCGIGGGGGTSGRMTRKLSTSTAAQSETATPTTATVTTTTGGKSGCGEGALTRRQQSTLEKQPPPPPRDCGYCEICRIEYDSLAVHVQSESHRAFVQNDDNFLSLDRLLGSICGGGGGLFGGPLEAQVEKGEGSGGGAAATPSSVDTFAGTGGERKGSDRQREEELAAERLAEERLTEEEQAAQKKTSSTTVTVTVTTTTTAAADELIEQRENPIGETTTTTLRERQQQQQQQQKVKQRQDHEANNPAERKRNSKLEDGESDDFVESSELGTCVTQELIKLALESASAYFNRSSEDDEASDTGRIENAGNTVNSTSSSVFVEKPSTRKRSNASKCTVQKVEGTPSAGKSDKSKSSAANSNSIVGGCSNIGEKEENSDRVAQVVEVVRKVRKGRSSASVGLAAGLSGVIKRFSRTSVATSSGLQQLSEGEQSVGEEEVPATKTTTASGGNGSSIQASLEEESSGMFGRRSAIHHHPHNQLNHHNHQKHKSTLSALLLKQLQEREQREGQPPLHERQVAATAISNSATIITTIADNHNHAAGMKVITDFRKEQQELVADKSVVVVVSAATAAAVAEDEKEKHTATTTSTSLASPNKRRKRRGATAATVVKAVNKQRQQELADSALAMGLKASTAAMNKHHNHHHPHLHHHEGASVMVGSVGAKTRHASEVASHHLLECDGLDPKNTKRISLGLRQNPKRANLNEDFTSLLDETLERSKTTCPSSSSAAAAARKAQARIRQPAKGARAESVKASTKADGGESNPEHPLEPHHNTSGCEEVNVGVGPIEADAPPLVKPKHDQAHGKGESLSATGGKRVGAVGRKSTTAAALEDIKVRGIRWRAPSPTTRPPVKSPLLYKVIEPSAVSAEAETGGGNTSSSRMGTAIVSSKKTTAFHSLASDNTTNSASTVVSPNSSQRRSPKSGKGSPKKNGLIVKIRRVRQSELSLLNDEAENFMFPRKDDSSSEADTDDDRQTSSEGFRRRPEADNNFSIDLPSSSEGERTKMEVEEDEDHRRPLEDAGGVDTADEEATANIHERRKEDERQKDPPTAAAAGRGRKRKKAILKANRGHSLVSEASSSFSLSSPGGVTAPPMGKRQRLEVTAGCSTSSSRKGRKEQQSADYDKCQDPPASRTRFPEAPIQPGPVAAAPSTSKERTRRRRCPSIVREEDGRSAADHDDQDDDDDGSGEKKQQRQEKARKGAGRGRGWRKKMEQEHTITSASATATADGCTGACVCSVISRRGRGGAAGRRGRRGRGAVSHRGGRGRMLSVSTGSICRCRLLDATRMPPPSGTIDSSGWRSNSDGDGSASSLAVTPARRRGGSRASKTKTTPPSSMTTGTGAEQREQSPSSSSCSIMNSSCYASGSTSSKGKEDGMGAVFKWINFRKRCEEIEPYRFAFERVPSLEPWYETFQRQDDGTEKVYEYFGSTGYRKLPYEMGPLPSLGHNCCILNYKVVACRKSNRTTSLQSSSSSSMEPPSPGKRGGGFRTSSTDAAHHPDSTSAGAAAASVTGVASAGDSDGKKSSPSSSLSSLPLKKRKLLLQDAAASGSGSGTTGSVDGAEGPSERSGHGSRISRLIAGANERPRKSPREHASTLAILSLLQQQQHRKRAAAIKILTSPKKATTATATQTSALLEHQFLANEIDLGDELSRRSSSRASDRGGVTSSNGGIKFERPLFPDSSYINSRTLCQEMDAFLTEELNRVGGGRGWSSTSPTSVFHATVKKEQPEEMREADDLPLLPPDAEDLKANAESASDRMEQELEVDEALLLPPSVVREGIAIERDSLPVSKRDLMDVLQTVGSEPPLSLKLVQRCESVVKKIVQYDRKTRPMLSGGSTCGGLGISSASSTVIGMQLFDSGSMLAACAGGPGAGSFLKKRINRTGWPTNKRKIGTRTRQQARFMIRSSISGRSAVSKAATTESIKKEPDEEEEEEEEEDEEEEKTDDDGEPQRSDLEPRNEDDGDDDEEEEEEDGCEDEDDDDDVDALVEASTSRAPKRLAVAGLCKKESAKAVAATASASHEKTEVVRGQQENDGAYDEDEKEEEQVEGLKTSYHGEVTARVKKRGASSKSDGLNKTACNEGQDDNLAMLLPETVGKEKAEQEESKRRGRLKAPNPAKDKRKKEETHRTSSAFDSMPTLRAALMRDNSQLSRHLHSPLLASSILAPKGLPGGTSSAVSTTSSVLLPPGSNNRGTAVTVRATMSGCSSLCQTTSGQSTMATKVSNSCCKYVTKTTTTMTRVDYDGVNSTITGLAPPGSSGASPTGKPPSGRKSREGVEGEEDTSRPKAGTAGVVDVARLGEWTSAESITGVANSSTNRLNRHRVGSGPAGSITLNHAQVLHGGTTTATSSSALANEEDDKECDSISSRSIFVSDDCDTTSSSILLNASEDVPPVTGDISQVNSSTTLHSIGDTWVETVGKGMPNAYNESSNNDEPAVEVRPSPEMSSPRAGGKGKARTPSERIRNKMVKNRRVAIKISRKLTLSAVEKASDDVVIPNHQQHTMEILPSRRRKSSSTLAPPPSPSQPQLPPPSMMPLSPPLTTSTSSSSSSSSGVDDKPMSPVPAGKEGRDDEEKHVDDGGETGVESTISTPILSPSKIKTRSSTFGRSPAKRTYGGPKAVTPVPYPYVSLARASFLSTAGEQHLSSVVPSPTSSPTIVSKRKRRRKEVKPKVSKTASSRRRMTSAKTNAAKPQKPEALLGKNKQQSKMAMAKQPKKSDVGDHLRNDAVELPPSSSVADGNGSKKKPVASKSRIFFSDAHLEVVPTVPKGFARERKLKMKLFNHAGGHFNSSRVSTFETHDVERGVANDVDRTDHDPLELVVENNIRHQDEEREEVDHQIELMEEHLIEAEEAEEDENDDEVPEQEGEEAETEEEGIEAQVNEEEEEEQIELLELMEVEEEDLDPDHEHVGQHEDEEEQDEAFLTGEEEEHEEDDQHKHVEEQRKLMIADHDYGDTRGHVMEDAEFVEVEELVDDLEELDEEQEEEEASASGDDEEDGHGSDNLEYEEKKEDAEAIVDTSNSSAPLVVGIDKQYVKLSSSLGPATGTAVAMSGTSTNVTNTTTGAAATTTSNNVSPTKYSPRKLRKPRGRWYRER